MAAVPYVSGAVVVAIFPSKRVFRQMYEQSCSSLFLASAMLCQNICIYCVKASAMLCQII